LISAKKKCVLGGKGGAGKEKKESYKSSVQLCRGAEERLLAGRERFISGEKSLLHFSTRGRSVPQVQGEKGGEKSNPAKILTWKGKSLRKGIFAEGRTYSTSLKGGGERGTHFKKEANPPLPANEIRVLLWNYSVIMKRTYSIGRKK